YSPVPSVEPSSTAMTSMRPGSMVCASTEARHSTRYGIASYAPMTTVTSGCATVTIPPHHFPLNDGTFPPYRLIRYWVDGSSRGPVASHPCFRASRHRDLFRSTGTAKGSAPEDQLLGGRALLSLRGVSPRRCRPRRRARSPVPAPGRPSRRGAPRQ